MLRCTAAVTLGCWHTGAQSCVRRSRAACIQPALRSCAARVLLVQRVLRLRVLLLLLLCPSACISKDAAGNNLHKAESLGWQHIMMVLCEKQTGQHSRCCTSNLLQLFQMFDGSSVAAVAHYAQMHHTILTRKKAEHQVNGMLRCHQTHNVIAQCAVQHTLGHTQHVKDTRQYVCCLRTVRVPTSGLRLKLSQAVR